MNNFSRRIKTWLDREGKIYLFRIVIFVSILATALSGFSIINISVNIILLFVLSLLLIFCEIFLEEISNLKKTNQDGLMMDWNSVIPFLREDAKKARRIVILARSGETSYYALQDIIKERGNKVEVSLVFTKTTTDAPEFIEYQQGWIKRWQKLFDESLTKHDIHRAITDFEPQYIIINHDEAYLNYRGNDKDTLWLKCGKNTNQSIFLINLYNSWISKLILQGNQNTTN